ncbi:MAG: C10 family peptidase, partial [Muribaculaceae bacterium]|nr:C10 family peptidase [Muribaculaceae bacterium]
MKRIHALLGALLCLTSTQMTGRTITPDEAIARVAGSSSMSKAPASYRLVHTDTGADGDATIYVFDDNAGKRMFLSADDKAEALLGYVDASASGSDEMPPQLQYWLREYSRQIEAIRGCESPLEAIAASVPERAEIAPMLTTSWAQPAPFNNLCPQVNETRTLTGCGATAMAQVMNYFKWPAHGTGIAVASGPNDITYSMDLATAHFDWANMADDYDHNPTEAQKDAVALLMKACGYAAKTEYSINWSNSTMVNIATALRENFDYAPTVRAYQMVHYGLLRWEEMIYNNLATTGPVIYRGNSMIEGGHIFVCDGYGGNGFFHFNWGWRGYYDGYFKLSALNPYYMYTGIDHGGFSEGQWAILGIQRPKDGLTSPEPEMYQEGIINGSVSGSTVYLSAGWYNASNETINTEFGVHIESRDGESSFTPVYVSCGPATTLAPDYGWYEIGFTLPAQDMPDGDYNITPVYRLLKQGASWCTPIHNNVYPNHVILQKTGTTYQLRFLEPYLMKISAVEWPETIYYGRTTELRLKFENTSDKPAASYFDTRILDENYS